MKQMIVSGSQVPTWVSVWYLLSSPTPACRLELVLSPKKHLHFTREHLRMTAIFLCLIALLSLCVGSSVCSFCPELLDVIVFLKRSSFLFHPQEKPRGHLSVNTFLVNVYCGFLALVPSQVFSNFRHLKRCKFLFGFTLSSWAFPFL